MPHRLNAALDEFERRLADRPAQDPDVAALAKVAATSEYHLRRMFSALAGMPLGEYVRRRRATLAAAAVVAGREPLLDVAVRFGYGSAEAFGRAFRSVHGVPPGEARRTGATLSGQQRLSFHVVVEGNAVMEYRVVQSGPFRLVGARACVPLVHEGLNPSIVAFLRGLPPQVRELVGTLSDGEPAGALNVSDGLGSDRAEGTELDYWFAAARYGGHSAAEDGLDSLDVPAGSWAVFTVSGPFPAIVQELWRDVFTQWFPSNPWRSRPGPEMLRNDLSDDGATTRAELWIPVEPADLDGSRRNPSGSVSKRP